MPDQEIVVHQVAPIHVVYLRETLPGVDRIPAIIQDGYAALIAAGVTPSGPAFSVFHDPAFRPEAFDYEVAYPVPEGTPLLTTPAGRMFEERVVPGGPTAVLVHRGPYEELAAAYGRMGQWISQQGMRPAGPPQEAYLTGPGDPAGLVTELRWPVA